MKSVLHVVIPEQIRVANESLEAIRGEVEKFRALRDEAYQSTAGCTGRRLNQF